jgi:hypothetical protein
MRLARQGVQLDTISASCIRHRQTTSLRLPASCAMSPVMTGRRCSSSALSSTSSKKRRGGFAGRATWKAMWRTQGLGTPDFEPADGSPDLVKHNPFSSFARIVRSQERWSHIENEAALFADLLNGDFPEYAWFTPNIWNHGHWGDGTKTDPKPRAPVLVDHLARWLEGFRPFALSRCRFPFTPVHAGRGHLRRIRFRGRLSSCPGVFLRRPQSRLQRPSCRLHRARLRRRGLQP